MMPDIKTIFHKGSSCMARFVIMFCVCLLPSFTSAMPTTISRGQPLPSVTLVGADHVAVDLNQLKGRVKILSIVPQLNTPVCDEQTHRFSENNGGLDRQVQIVTICTNTFDDQQLFARKSKIKNITFLSDSPAFEFGRKTGLLHPMHQILQRAVLVVDQKNFIRYVEIVPMSQLPDFEAAYDAARQVLAMSNE